MTANYETGGALHDRRVNKSVRLERQLELVELLRRDLARVVRRGMERVDGSVGDRVFFACSLEITPG